jgi:superfamily II DNA or RNA helicase/HKD family nuclease
VSFESPSYRRIRRVNGLPVEGLYDSLIDGRVSELLESARRAGFEVATRPMKGRDARLVARELAVSLLESLEARLGLDEKATPSDIELANRLLAFIGAGPDNEAARTTSIQPQVLERIGPKRGDQPPDLSDHGLLTGREGTGNLLLQLRRELATCDRVDWLVSFIKLSAVKLLQTDVAAFLERGGSMRVVTTAYMGATDPKALDALAAVSRQHHGRLRIRFSTETDSTRLHAKAYIHSRSSGFGSAYVGSANLSRPALTDGLEWTVRLSQVASPGLWTKIEETFEQWWGDPEFTEYGLAEDHPTHQQFRDLVARESGALAGVAPQAVSLPLFDLEPKPFQQAILDKIEVDRSLGRRRHLVVAATGTGKTMIAAFDYRRFEADFVAREGRRPKLLYIAHSERILRQARVMFGQVLRDLNFGGFLVGGENDWPCHALFASIQSWSARVRDGSMFPDDFDYVVVDEVHHGEAPTWRELLESLDPASLLGLTATPERADGSDVTRHFESRVTAEIRLPDAIARRLLVPFRYFGITDDIDLREVGWSSQRGYVMSAVESRYILAGQAWVSGVSAAIDNYVANPSRMRAIGFCSGVDHARHMASVFERWRATAESQGRAGLRAESLDGSDDLVRRDEVIGRLRRGETQLVFVADLFNEGVDIPEVDTVLFMRPTNSLTVFLQQLGRGLRLSPGSGKDCLTVLDFVGQHRQEYRFDQRLRALLADPGVSIEGQVRSGFSALPAGCSVTLERVAQERVIASIRSAIRGLTAQWVEDIRFQREQLERHPSLREFLDWRQLDPRELYSGQGGRRTWYALRQAVAGDGSSGELSSVSPFLAGLGALAAMRDNGIASFGVKLLKELEHSDPRTVVAGLSQSDRLRCDMVCVGFADAVKRKRRLDRAAGVLDVLAELRENSTLRTECQDLLDAGAATAGLPRAALAQNVTIRAPLAIHGSYTRAQVLAAFGWEKCWSTTSQGGVLWLPNHEDYLMFVTLDKDEAGFTERTRYRDYAVSPSVFHWQSPAASHARTKDGRRILGAKEGRGTMWLFVRQSTDDEFGTSPFCFVGAFRPTELQGERPISVIGELAVPLPPAWFEIASRAR